MHFRRPEDDPAGPLARRDVELAEVRPVDPRPLTLIDHEVTVGLAHSLPIRTADGRDADSVPASSRGERALAPA
jgi:hypothetical protein